MGCVVLGSYSPTLCRTTVKRQIWPGNFSANEKWTKPETSAKCCKYRFIDRKIPQKGKILSFLSLHFPFFPHCFSLVSASLLFIYLIPAFHKQMYFGRRCRDSTGLTGDPVQQDTCWEVCLTEVDSAKVSLSYIGLAQKTTMGGCLLQNFFFDRREVPSNQNLFKSWQVINQSSDILSSGLCNIHKGRIGVLPVMLVIHHLLHQFSQSQVFRLFLPSFYFLVSITLFSRERRNKNREWT